MSEHQREQLRQLADAIAEAKAYLQNDLYKSRIKNAIARLDEVQDIVENWQSDE